MMTYNKLTIYACFHLQQACVVNLLIGSLLCAELKL